MTTELEYDDIPAEVIELAKELILDTVGCMIGGHGQHPLPELAHHLQKKGGVEEAYIMVPRRQKGPRRGSRYGNGTHASRAGLGGDPPRSDALRGAHPASHALHAWLS